MTGPALYVYAVVPDRPGAADGVTGIDGRPLRLPAAPGTGLAALVHDAEPAPYQGTDEDVRRRVAEQDRAVVAVWERTGALLPMTFNVLVAPDPSPQDPRTAEERLRDWLTSRAAGLRSRLEALEGRAELRVEITVDRAESTRDDERARALEAEMASRSPGLRRLLARQLEQLRRESSERLADVLHADVRRRLLAVAEDLRERSRGVRDPGEADVLSAALLVRTEDIEAVGTVLAAVQGEQPAARIRFLGPWPPYTFADLPDGPRDPAAPEQEHAPERG
ncbi:GvpL/GvpF family gas vesicle protein [Streptomyces pini]|uniref:Gas vesicle synthesis protein GvpL/GvpF n=1 Tax=Streptomyces pini TaxID=1520580 RepID=A0A1I3YGI3_9ACTN|nr:GvpL/GvpF family gas vesicle protein [Streptomyces pini]SFK30306.1 Gas vesicle synthesis protein GvpL/GvpF [Streptomyces pini]